MRYLSLALLFLFITLEASSQSFYHYKRGRNVIASAGTGTSTYFGDLKPDGDIIDPKLNFNVGLQYLFTERIAARAEVSWFRLEGDDSKGKDADLIQRNLSFRSDNIEISVVGMYNLFPNGTKYYQRKPFNVYAFAGFALLYFNPTAELNGERYALQPIQTEGVSYSRSTIALPYGIGVRYKINPFFNIALEGGFRQTFTDYLDDVSTNYVDNASFTDPAHAILADRRVENGFEPAPAGRIRGNSDKNDNYYNLNLKLEFYVPSQILGSSKPNQYKKRKSQKRRR